MYKHILYQVLDGVGEITLNRPEAMNALNHNITGELLAVLRECAKDESVRAVLITGAGKMFCAGGDVKWMASSLGSENWEAEFNRLLDLLHPAIMEIRQMPKPVIAGVNGFAAGAGFSIALACDIRIASSDAKFNQAYINIGLSPDGGSTYFLTKMLGVARATDLIFSGRIIDAAEAYSMGLLNKVIPAESFPQEMKALAVHYANGPTKAYAKAKNLINQAEKNNLETQLNQETTSIVSASLSSDFSEGIKAFVEKRKANFKGK